MVTVEFDFNQKITKIQGKLDEPFKNFVDKYFLKTSIEPTSVYFLANGKILNFEQTIESQMTEINKKNKQLTVLVNFITKEKKYNEEVIIKSKDIICPKCHEPCRIKIQNSKIKLFGCINNHIIDDIKFTNFNDTQKINISEIICNNCKIKNLGNCPNNEFYYCITCNINLCLLCKPNHNQHHNIIKYTQKHYICQKHNEIFDEYCKMCNMNICFWCQEHEKHKTISFKQLKPDLIKAKRYISEIKAEIDVFNNKVKEIIEILNNLVKIINVYYEINYDIINNYELKNRNYQNLKNLEEINDNNDLFEHLKKVNQAENIKDKIINILNMNEIYCDNNSDTQKRKSELDINLQNNELENQEKIIENKVNPLIIKSRRNTLDNNNNNIPMKKMNLNTPNKNMNQFQIMNSNLNKNNFNIDSINNQIIIKPIKRTRPLDLYTEPTLIGLQNIGAPSFMNAILQCLSQTDDLTNYFLDEELSFDRIINNNVAIKNKNDLQLSPVFLELLKNLWNKNSKRSYYEPKKLMETIAQINFLFKRENACDSKDFIFFLLDQLHKELQKTTENKNYNNITLYDPYDRKKAFSDFLENFINQTSIISDIFYGILESNLICLNCKNNLSSQGKAYPIEYYYCYYNFLIFPLQEVKKYRNYHIGQNNSLTLKDCFLYDQKIELFTGDNHIYCEKCKQMSDANYIFKIYSAPNVLILILKQGKNNGFNIKLDFTETIDITDFVTLKKSKVIYNLYGVISEFREIGSSSKFLAFCKSPINNKWYRYDDIFITEVKNFIKEVIDFGQPNILFYKLQN